MAGAESIFRKYLSAGEIKLQLCTDCNRYIYYPRDFCHHCHSDQLDWRDISGKGIIYSVTVAPARKDGDEPRNTVLVDLDEGVRVLSRVDDLGSASLEIGMRVRSKISEWNGVPILVFVPEASGD